MNGPTPGVVGFLIVDLIGLINVLCQYTMGIELPEDIVNLKLVIFEQYRWHYSYP